MSQEHQHGWRWRVAGDELIDRTDTPVDALSVNLREQAAINRFCGGYAATLRHALPFLLAQSSAPLRVLEMGCGGADISRRLVDGMRRAGRAVTVVGLDHNPRVLACARAWGAGYPEIALVCADALHPPFPPGAFDLVLLPDVLHHLTTPDAVALLRLAGRLSRGLVVAADLVRSPGAAACFALLARLARFGRVTRSDGALSIRRAFTPPELAVLAAQARLPAWRITRHAFFRMALVY